MSKTLAQMSPAERKAAIARAAAQMEAELTANADNISAVMDGFTECDYSFIVKQIGAGNWMAISGRRVIGRRTGATFPVSCGYSVTVDLAGDNTWTVRRVFKRGTKTWVKGQETGIHAEQLGDSAYRASCFRNVTFGEHTP